MAIPDGHDRITVDLPHAVTQRLAELASDDGIPRAVRMRWMVTLGVDDAATQAQVRAALSSAATQAHPKVNPRRGRKGT